MQPEQIYDKLGCIVSNITATGIPRSPQWRQQPYPSLNQTQTQMARQTNRWTIIPISVDKLKASHLDTSVCQNVDHFFPAISLQYLNSIPWMVRRMDECTKWQQYPSASMSAEGKLSGYINMPFLCHSFQVLCKQMHRNLKMWWMDRRTGGRTIIFISINKLRVSHLDI